MLQLNRYVRLVLCTLFLSSLTVAAAAYTADPATASATRAGLHGNIVVYHEPTPAPTYLDQGLPGDSVGDVRVFHFSGETQAGSEVVMEWIMTTTGLDTAPNGGESRVTLGVFSFSGADEDQILIEGVGLYPDASDTFVPDSKLVRAIIGGTGRFRGATGDVLSTHLADGSWTHEFRMAIHAGRVPLTCGVTASGKIVCRR